MVGWKLNTNTRSPREEGEGFGTGGSRVGTAEHGQAWRSSKPASRRANTSACCGAVTHANMGGRAMPVCWPSTLTAVHHADLVFVALLSPPIQPPATDAHTTPPWFSSPRSTTMTLSPSSLRLTHWCGADTKPKAFGGARKRGRVGRRQK